GARMLVAILCKGSIWGNGYIKLVIVRGQVVLRTSQNKLIIIRIRIKTVVPNMATHMHILLRIKRDSHLHIITGHLRTRRPKISAPGAFVFEVILRGKESCQKKAYK